MTKQRPVLAAVLAATALGVLYRSHVKPWMYRWGATTEEVDSELPGDELLRPGLAHTTRAIDIAAPIEGVWPWIAQIGEDRGGFYSYSWLERAAGAHVHNASTIHSEWQDVRVGDVVWLAQRFADRGRQVVGAVVPKSHLVLVSTTDFDRISRGELATGSWAFHVQPTAGGSRLLIRGSGGAVGHAVFDLPHYIMERKMMLGIRRRAEHQV